MCSNQSVWELHGLDMRVGVHVCLQRTGTETCYRAILTGIPNSFPYFFVTFIHGTNIFSNGLFPVFLPSPSFPVPSPALSASVTSN